ncbi:D-alanine--D-alanine ligase [Acidisphaera sp. L21]|jgi:hypothetical protein|uniref:D-alanine--D-alanine ligase n=1 Tax=Acidisphaera sp. L21 TaxID=1641851 RepID=UPI00131B8B97|nr:D-alanine--D-alanine ligase [Acidisphaera sp. L21]
MIDTTLSVGRTAQARERIVSPFEFWPSWLFYAPVVAQWIWLGLRYGDMSLPTAANPTIETGGLCGESKSAILDMAEPDAQGWIAPYVTLRAGIDDVAALAERAGFGWPVVLKPDIGCNGAGVRLAADPAALQQAAASFPRGVALLLQRFVPEPNEAGLFYIRHPHEETGRITSVTLKRQPSVTGDGRNSLETLIRNDPRAGQVPQLYLPRLTSRLAEIPAAGEIVPLVFTGNHCKGSVFLDGADRITPALTRQVDAIARAIPGFYFGRIDVRYGSEAALRLGQGFTVIEVNGAGSEATHIWDARCTLRDAYVSQFMHYRAAWEIGRANRAAGARPTGLWGMFRAWRRQQALMASYPNSD